MQHKRNLAVTKVAKRHVRIDAEGAEHVVSDESAEIPEEETYVNPAFVGVKLGLTINLQNYESARVEVYMGMPCLATDEAMMRTCRRVSRMVDECIREEEAKADPSLAANKPKKKTR